MFPVLLQNVSLFEPGRTSTLRSSFSSCIIFEMFVENDDKASDPGRQLCAARCCGRRWTPAINILQVPSLNLCRWSTTATDGARRHAEHPQGVRTGCAQCVVAAVVDNLSVLGEQFGHLVGYLTELSPLTRSPRSCSSGASRQTEDRQ
jgi:hypothetical protein